MNPTKNLIELKLHMNPTKNLIENKLHMNPTHGEVYSIQHYVIKATGWLFSIPVSSINKSDHHDITEILLIYNIQYVAN
jgi:hypothetical protein